MNTHPRRRKSKDNPYEIIKTDEKYIISFKDGKNILRSVEINLELYEAFNKFELEDISQMHKFERHIEYSEIYDENLNNRSLNKTMKLEDYIINKILFEELHIAIGRLSIIQKRRIKMYYFDNMTLNEIAVKEKCSIHSIFVSIERAKENLKKILTKGVKNLS